jgi:uncharacterized repeat protein (TIGR01451 family)
MGRMTIVQDAALVGAAVMLVGAVGLASRAPHREPGRLVAPRTVDGAGPPAAATTARHQALDTLGQLPLRFEANQGQFDPRAQFATRGLNYAMWLTPAGAVLSLQHGASDASALRVSLVGAAPAPAVAGIEPLPGVTNYYQGNDPARWQTNVRTYGRVRYASIYDGIDLVYYGNQQRLEYDFVIAPGHDPAAIRLQIEGARRVELDGAGDLVMHVPGGEPVRQHKPVTYQEIDGVRHDIESRYVLRAGDQVGFEVGDYDRSAPLTIDPVLIYSTFFGGTSQEFAYDIALDPAGNIYLTGQTTAGAGFPTTPGAYQPTKPGQSDAFVAKFNPSGTTLVYSTFLGGTGNENTRSQRSGRIVADAAGNAYVAGDTNSVDFPVGGAGADTVFGGGATGQTDAFYVKLGPTGAFLYGTYIGGNDYDYAVGIGVDSTGNVYVAGGALSDAATFPQTPNGYDLVRNGYDAFLTKFDASGTRVYSTFLGGTGGDNYNVKAGGLAIDDQGRAYLTGDTYSTDFPIVGGYQTAFSGPSGYDVYLAVIDTTLSGPASLVYSTYLGGPGTDIGLGIAYAGARQVVIVGQVSTGFPTKNALYPTYGGGNSDAFVAKFDTSLTGNASLLFSTYLGGSDYDYAWDVAVDPQGAIHVVGDVRSTDFPLVNPISTGFDYLQMFATKMNASGSALIYSTYFGGLGNGKGAQAVATNAAGDTYIAGHTNNDRSNPTFPDGFPIVSPFQGVYGGGGRDAFITRLGNGVDLQLTNLSSPEPVAPGATLTYTLTVTNNGTDPALSVTLNDPLPAGVAFGSCVATLGGACGGSGNARTVTFASIAAGASATVTITATVNVGMGSTIVNTATVTTASFDPNPANNTSTATSHTPGVNPNDTDNDALPNDWETKFGLDPNSGAGINGPGGDPDGDGRTNYQEYLEGSHPRGFVITYLAEGATGAFFQTRIAIANPSSATALVLTRFQRADGVTIPLYSQIAPHARATIDVETVPGLESADFSTLIEADVQVVADRTMTWDHSSYGSHAERGILTRTATTWYLAEGATHGGFSLFYLLQNPGNTPANVEISYLLPAPQPPIVLNYVVAPTSRRTIPVDDEPGLSATDVSAILRSTNGVPFIAERSMYFSRPDQAFAAGHESAGVTAPSSHWFLAEGATGSFFNMFILIANPSTEDANVQLQYLLPDGSTVTKTHVVAAQSRLTLNAALEDPLLQSASFSTVANATNGVGIIVERAMWWPANNPGGWYEAHNSPGETTTGVKWAMAEGESGGSVDKQTYILIANTSSFVGSARVTLLFEDGTTDTKDFALPANGRTTVNVQVEFASSANKRYGAVVESLGTTPAALVVERAMYSNANGVVWAAGTDALATKLQ